MTPPPPPTYATAAERAMGVAEWIVSTAEVVTDDSVRWRMAGSAMLTNLYEGQAGVLVFLSEMYRVTPTPKLRSVIERGGRWLMRQPAEMNNGLYAGTAGRAWSFLSMNSALGGGEWLDAALALAPRIAASKSGPPADLISGIPGQGLFLLRLYDETLDGRWLEAARALGDVTANSAVPIGDGVKFPTPVGGGVTWFYTGLSHGTAGGAYFLSRLARALPEHERGPYERIVRSATAWLEQVASPTATGVNWYRREPDQMEQRQVQWCHGAPGVGMFFVELYRLTRDPAHLMIAERCAATVDAAGRLSSSGLCHGVSGNAQLYLMLFRETGDEKWLAKARAFGDFAWGRRIDGYHPAWTSGDEWRTNHPGLLTGTSGVGWFYLQLARGGTLGDPVIT